MIRLMLVLSVLTFPVHTIPVHLEHFTEAQNRFLRDLFSKGGANCCSTADGATVKDPDWGVANGAYWVFLDGARREVPAASVVDAKNPFNHALVWVVWMNGVPQIKCFLPGHLS